MKSRIFNFKAILFLICSFGQLSFYTSQNIANNSPKFLPVLPIHIQADDTQIIEINASNTDLIEPVNLPDFVSFTDFGNGSAMIEIFPNNTNTGSHELVFIAKNAILSTGISIPLTVYPNNGISQETPSFTSDLNVQMSADSTYHTWIHATYTNQIIAPQLPQFITLTDYGDGASELFINPKGINLGSHEIEFLALGPNGKDTLNFNLIVEPGLVAPQDSLCHLSTVEMFSTTDNFGNLFDEQYLTADPIANLPPHPATAWTPGWDWSIYPTMGYIDFGSPQPITKIFLNDGIGGGTFNIYMGSSPTDYDTMVLASDNLTLFDVWHEHDINKTTQYLFFEMQSPQAAVREVLIYGMCDLELDTIPPSPINDLYVDFTTSKTAQLSWSKTGDDHQIGNATAYDFRYSQTPITDSTFYQLPSFLIENTTTTSIEKILKGLDCNKDYYFAVKAIDDVNNVSTLSNVVNASTSDCNPNITITVTFDNDLISTPQVDITKLRFNKDFAYSFTLDDGSVWEYNVTYPILNGGVTPNGETNEGFYYTDGCGNDEVFRAGAAINGFWLLDEPFGNNFMTWDEVQTLYLSDWDIINHSFSHCSDSCDYIPEVLENIIKVEEKLGFTMTHFAVPSGDNEGYRLPAFNNGMLALHDQYFPTPHKYGIQVDPTMNLDSFELHRNTLEWELPPYGEDIDSVATLSQNGDHFWFSEYAHRIGYPTDPFIYVYANDFKNYMTHIENTFGRFGADNIWFAPVQEVFEYIQVRDNIEITTMETNGDQLTIQLSTSDIPISLRRNSLSLFLDISNQPTINNIQVTNANVTFNTDGLINLNW